MPIPGIHGLRRLVAETRNFLHVTRPCSIMHGVTNTAIATTCHSSHVDSRPSVILSVVFSLPAKQPKQPNHEKKTTTKEKKKKTTLTAEQERQAKLRRKKPETQTY
jgi:4-aminobutyrate aminotransferase-like enzyme